MYEGIGVIVPKSSPNLRSSVTAQDTSARVSMLPSMAPAVSLGQKEESRSTMGCRYGGLHIFQSMGEIRSEVKNIRVVQRS